MKFPELKSDPLCEIESFRISQLRAGVIRRVGNKRARKLRKRGEFVWFCQHVHSYVWEPS